MVNVDMTPLCGRLQRPQVEYQAITKVLLCEPAEAGLVVVILGMVTDDGGLFSNPIAIDLMSPEYLRRDPNGGFPLGRDDLIGAGRKKGFDID